MNFLRIGVKTVLKSKVPLVVRPECAAPIQCGSISSRTSAIVSLNNSASVEAGILQTQEGLEIDIYENRGFQCG